MNERGTDSRSLRFSVQGQFITRLAREKVFQENPPRIAYAIKLLMSCLETDQMSEGDRLLLAVKILNGQARIIGTYPDDDYGVEILDEPEGKFDLFERVDRMCQEIAQLKEDNRELSEKLCCVADEIDDWRMRAINRIWRTEYGGTSDIFPDIAAPVFRGIAGSDDVADDPVADALDRMRSGEDDDYGWLAPDGTFYPVEFAEHQSWAWKKLKDLKAIEGHELNTGRCGDKLVDMGWALLHNPGMGTAFVTSSDTKPLTKRQKEFLFDYYTKRNKHEKARAYLDE